MTRSGSLIKLGILAALLWLTPRLVLAGHEFGRSPSKASVNTQKPTHYGKDATPWPQAYGDLPLAFERNVGQADPQVQFLARDDAYEIFLTPRETVLAFRPTAARAFAARNQFEKELPARKTEQDSLICLRLQGANPAAPPLAIDKLPTKIDYFIGNNPRNWHTDVPSFSRVEYRDVYRGIDLAYYGNHRQFEYDFIVNPGANPKSIAFNVRGADKLRLDHQGNLVLEMDGHAAQFRKPMIYQTLAGQRREIAGNYVLSSEGRVSFFVAAYDRSQPLIIDPVLNYSTYLGGSASGDLANGVAVDASGDAYITGQTYSASFPTTSGAYSTTVATDGSVFVSELNPTGTALLYSTYLSGDVGEYATSIALDPAPSPNCLNGLAPGVCVYITGETFSTAFPTTANGYSNGLNSGNSAGTAFIAKLNPAASGADSLVYSSYLGGYNGDFGSGIAVDANAIAYVTGYTNSTPGAAPADFTVVGGYQNSLNSSVGNAFLAAIDTTQIGASSLVYSTYLGGSGLGATLPFGDVGIGVAVDSAKTAYVVGSTSSPDFPTTANAYSQTPASFSNGTSQAVFLAKINTNAATPSSSLVYSTYVAGAAPVGDIGYAIALGPNNLAYVTGQTGSTSFPVIQPGTAGQYPSAPSAAGVAFVSVLDTTKSNTSALIYSELLGGNAGDGGLGIRADSLGNAYIAGVTDSTNFPIVAGAFQPVLRDTLEGDAFVAKINVSGSGSAADLLYSTYFGGSGGNSSTALPDRAYGIALDAANNVYIAGQTNSAPSSSLTGPYNNFPVFASGGAAVQGTIPANSAAAFVAKLTLIPTVVVSPTSLLFSSQVVGVPSAAQTVTLTNNTNAAITLAAAPSITAGTPAASGTDFATTGNACTGNLAAGASCTVGVTFTPSVSGSESATLFFSDTDNLNPAMTQSVALSGTAVGAVDTISVTPSTLTFASQTLNTTSAAQTVTVTNTGNAPVIFGANAVSISGDFSQTNTCNGATLAAPPASATSCTVSVQFTPTASTNPRAGTLTIADSATGSPQTVSLTGTASTLTPDFSLTAPSSPVTITAGSASNFVVEVVSVGGFNSAVSLSCTGSIPQGSCVAPGSSITPTVAPGTAATFMINSQGILVTVPASRRIPPASHWQVILLALAGLLLMLLPFMGQPRLRFGLVGALAVLMLLAGCGSVSSNNKTPSGSYMLTVTGTSGSTVHTANVTINVQ